MKEEVEAILRTAIRIQRAVHADYRWPGERENDGHTSTGDWHADLMAQLTVELTNAAAALLAAINAPEG